MQLVQAHRKRAATGKQVMLAEPLAALGILTIAQVFQIHAQAMQMKLIAYMLAAPGRVKLQHRLFYRKVVTSGGANVSRKTLRSVRAKMQ